MDGPEPRHRLARLSLLATLLTTVAVLLLLLAVWQARTIDGSGAPVELPVAAPITLPAVAVVIAVLLAIAGQVAALSAANVRVTMQVLRRDRRVPPTLPDAVAQLRARVLATPSVRLPEAGRELLPTALPATGFVPGPLRLTVLVPAYNEELTIERALESLRTQTRPPDRVVVVADNCTDRTAEIARLHGAEVRHTEGNVEKKAGALNQQLAELLPHTGPHDVVMVMDADTVLAPRFLEVALAHLDADPDLIAVGGIFYGEDGGGLVGQLQRSEFSRYQRQIARRAGRIFVLTGTASLIRAYGLQAVADARGTLIPGPAGKVYDTLALTEDNELTLALKTLGARMISPQECRCVTEIMPTWRALWRQRARWERGALENIGTYGVTRPTGLNWFQQIAIGYGTIALWSYLVLMGISLLAAPTLLWSWFWMFVGLVFVVERVVTVWEAGWTARLVAATMVPELAFAVFLQVVYVKSLIDIASGRHAGWNTVVRDAAAR